MAEKKFNYRAFTSLVLFLIFIIITITGIILYTVPPGRIAHWNHWTLWKIDKDGWQRIHTVFTFLFIIFSLVHLILYNWKTFTRYISGKKEEKRSIGKEVYASLGITLLLLAVTVAGTPPFTTLMQGGESIKNSWYGPESEPPIPHAELFTIDELCQRLGIDPEKARSNLKAAKIKIKSRKQRLGGIARKNKKSARAIFMIISNTEKTPKKKL